MPCGQDQLNYINVSIAHEWKVGQLCWLYCKVYNFNMHKISGSSMNFSEAFQQTKYLVQFSPDGRYIASCSQYRLVIRDVQTLQITNLHTCLDPVQQFIWSPDSQFIMCAMFKRGIVQVSDRIPQGNEITCSGMDTPWNENDSLLRRLPAMTTQKKWMYMHTCTKGFSGIILVARS